MPNTLDAEGERMQAWFVRSNGSTLHNNPSSPLYVAGEPPRYPERDFDYRHACIESGFARLGMPAAGDLNDLEWRARVQSRYGTAISDSDVRALDEFRSIQVGDVVVMPAGVGKDLVHIGLVEPPPNGGPSAYYYRYDVAQGDWFENAHRVNVEWARDTAGRPAVVEVVGIPWRRKFSRLTAASAAAIAAADRLRLSADTVPLEPQDPDDEFPEGRELSVTHRERERNPQAVRAKKAAALQANGRLVCEVCGFDFAAVYGLAGTGYIECHHIQPISEYEVGQTTTLADLALVCSNCHRVLHRARPWMTLGELRSRLTKAST